MAFFAKFVYVAHRFIFLWLNPFDITVDRKGLWFEHSMSYSRVWLSAESAKIVSWSWLSPFRGWSILTMAFTGKIVYVAHHLIFLQFHSFDLTADREGWLFKHSISQLQVLLSAEGAQNVSWSFLSPPQECGSLTMTFTTIFVYMTFPFILLQFNPFDLKLDRKGWWFKTSMSELWVWLSAKGAKGVSWPWVSPLR